MNTKPWTIPSSEEFKAIDSEKALAKALGISEEDMPKASICIYLVQKVFSDSQLPYIFVSVWLSLLNQEITNNLKLAEYFFDSLTDEQLLVIAIAISQLDEEPDTVLLRLIVNLLGKENEAE